MNYNPEKTNLHTHTARCKHAEGCVADYVLTAASQGCQLLGLTDHCPFPDNHWLMVRMESSELEPYLDEIEAARELAPQMDLVAGLECEYIPERHSYYEEVLLGNPRVAFLVSGVHWVRHGEDWLGLGEISEPAHLLSHARDAIHAMESGLFSFLAHPDNFGVGYLEWDENCEACSRDILAAAATLQVPLEINGYGMRKPTLHTEKGTRWRYPLQPFWALAEEYDIRVVCNSDAHQPMDVLASIREGLEIAKAYNLSLADPKDIIPALRAEKT